MCGLIVWPQSCCCTPCTRSKENASFQKTVRFLKNGRFAEKHPWGWEQKKTCQTKIQEYVAQPVKLSLNLAAVAAMARKRVHDKSYKPKKGVLTMLHFKVTLQKELGSGLFRKVGANASDHAAKSQYLLDKPVSVCPTCKSNARPRVPKLMCLHESKRMGSGNSLLQTFKHAFPPFCGFRVNLRGTMFVNHSNSPAWRPTQEPFVRVHAAHPPLCCEEHFDHWRCDKLEKPQTWKLAFGCFFAHRPKWDHQSLDVPNHGIVGHPHYRWWRAATHRERI